MKKLMLATVLASTSTLAMAGAFDGLYVQGDVGLSKLEVKVDGDKAKDNNTGYSIALGKDMGVLRYQADYTDFGKVEEKGSDGDLSIVGNDEWTATLKAQSLGVSAIYDFKPVFGVTPYAGLRLGINQLKAEDSGRSSTIDPTNNQQTIISYHESDKKTKVGVGVLAGVQYAFTPKLALDTGVEYHHLGKVEDYKFNQYGVKVGLRYNF